MGANPTPCTKTMNGYLTLEQAISIIQDPERARCHEILEQYRRLFEQTPGSSHNHQAWPGGYVDHVTDTMNIAHLLYGVMNECRPLPFTLSDALYAIFLHDIEKPFKQGLGAGVDKDELKQRTLAHLEAELTQQQRNAVFYAEGEKDYTNSERKMGELAAFVHMCDIASARIWHDHPQVLDTWGTRHRKGYGWCVACYAGVLTKEEMILTKRGLMHIVCERKIWPAQQGTDSQDGQGVGLQNR